MSAYITWDKFKNEGQVPVDLFDESGTIVAVCSILNVSGYGKTIQEAMENFHVAMRAFIRETMQHGTLPDALKNNGWDVQQVREGETKVKPPVKLESRYERIAAAI